MGIGGAPEAVLAACALKCVGGEMQCRLYPRTEAEKDAAIAHGLDPVEFDRVLTIDDLCASDNVFFAATGVTDGELPAWRAVFRARRAHALPHDAVPLGHRPLDRGTAPLGASVGRRGDAHRCDAVARPHARHGIVDARLAGN